MITKESIAKGQTERFQKFLDWAREQGHRQSDVANRLMVARQYVSNVKSGSRKVTELLARRIANEFNIDFQWLLTGVGTMQDGRTELQEERTERFRQFLDWAKQKKNYRQNTIAKRLHVQSQYVTDVKSGARNLSKPFALKIVEEFYIGFDWLWHGEGDMETSTKGRRTFQEAVASETRELFRELLKEHPELRSVAVVFDWVEGLNESALPGLWYDREGPMSPGNCDAITGSMSQTAKLMAVQADMGLRMISVFDETARQKLGILKQIEEHLDGKSKAFEGLGKKGQETAEELRRQGGAGSHPGKPPEAPED